MYALGTTWAAAMQVTSQYFDLSKLHVDRPDSQDYEHSSLSATIHTVLSLQSLKNPPVAVLLGDLNGILHQEIN